MVCPQPSGMQVLNKNNVPTTNTGDRAFRHWDFHNLTKFPQFPQFPLNCGNCGKNRRIHNFIEQAAPYRALLLFERSGTIVSKKNTAASPYNACGTFCPTGFHNFRSFPQFPQFRLLREWNCGNCGNVPKLWKPKGRMVPHTLHGDTTVFFFGSCSRGSLNSSNVYAYTTAL